MSVWALLYPKHGGVKYCEDRMQRNIFAARLNILQQRGTNATLGR